MPVISQVTATNKLIDAEFIRLDVPGAPGTPFTFSNSYRRETFTATTFVSTFTNLGALVSVSGHQRDLSITSFDTSITLVGVDQTKVGQVIDAGLKGSKVQVWRGFYTPNYELDGEPVLRYTGIVTSFDITEDVLEGQDTFTLSLNCSSYKTVLENRVAGRFTNPNSWNLFNSNDVSMSKVNALHNSKFNFGQKLA